MMKIERREPDQRVELDVARDVERAEAEERLGQRSRTAPCWW